MNWKSVDGKVREERIHKTRPDDFIAELQYLDHHMQGTEHENYLSLEKGLDTMLVIAASYLSSQVNRSVRINYSKGYSPEALEII